MDKQDKIIFLSAGIPYIDEERGDKYFKTADIIAIRDAVRALAIVAYPNSKIIWGGQPSITPLISHVLQTLKAPSKQNVKLYQSAFFKPNFPKENDYFEDYAITPIVENDRGKSLSLMRDRMLSENRFTHAIFIGGMNGIKDEFDMFKKKHSKVPAFPIASTGGGAALVYEEYKDIYKFDPRLKIEHTYINLFKDLLK